jgi:ubiquinone/menaquinone biosynthesis C-methylase UbiE
MGCGPGGFSRALLDKHKNMHVTCMDIDSKFVEYNEDFNEKNPQYRGRMKNLQGSIFHTNLPSNHFDLIISRFVFQHLVNIQQVQRPIETATLEMKRILKPGGKLILVDSDHEFPDTLTPECESCLK